MELRVLPKKIHYCKNTKLGFEIENKTKKKLGQSPKKKKKKKIRTKRTKTLTKYRQLAFETREQRPGYKTYMVSVVLGAMEHGIKALKVDLRKIFDNNKLLDKVVAMMQKTVLMDSEIIVKRVTSGLIQGKVNE